MKNTFLSALLSFVLLAPLSAQEIENVEIVSSELGQTREIMVYTPMNYGLSEYELYHTIYVFDAHDRSLFDYTSSIAHLLQEGHRGFIVVGIKATYIDEEGQYYGRNNDLLPSSSSYNLGPDSKGNAEAYLAYVKNEVIPYVESNYNVFSTRTGVGHSLGASFIVYSLLEEPEVFDNYVAVSPNLAYDNQFLVEGLKNFDINSLKSTNYFYLSHANEAQYWKSWGPANERADAILKDQLQSDKFQVAIENYPQEWHRPVFVPSVKTAMQNLLQTVEPDFNSRLSTETYTVTLKVRVPSEADELYVAGNQPTLGDWDPGKVKMQKTSPLEREITLEVQGPAEFKFTRGSWETEAWMKIEGGQANHSSMIRPLDNEVYEFEIVTYMDTM